MGASRVVILALALSLAVSTASRAQVQTFRVDAGASSVRIQLAATLHTVEGRARIVSGEIRFDAESGAAEGRVILDARSVDTGLGARDAKMHDEVLESERYPEISFSARRIEVLHRTLEELRFVLHGQLSIHGATHSLALPTRAELGAERVRASSRVVLPYVAWGMKGVSTFLLSVADEVSVEIEVVGDLAP